MDKKCSKCKQTKPENEFNWRNKSKGTRQPSCKMCTRESIRAHYRSNKKYYVDKAESSKKKVKRRNKDFIKSILLEGGCVDCGECDIRVLHFDHVSGTKEYNVARLVGSSLLKIQHEIDKCEIRCANCHMKKTFDQLGWSK